MTPTELRAALDRLGWNRSELARRLGYASETSIRQWKTTPPAVAEWLGRVERAVQKIPPPPRNMD